MTTAAQRHKAELIERIRGRVAALVLLALIAATASLTVAMYNKSFVDTATVTIETDRAGLQMRKGTVVKYRGVDVGAIEKAEVNGSGNVTVSLAMKPEMLSAIPVNVHVALRQLTAFGNKAVELSAPKTPSTDHLQAGAVLQASSVSVEVNTLLDRLDSMLGAIRPAQLNSTLRALADSVRGQGEGIGEMIDLSAEYLKKINQDLPQIGRGFDKAAATLDLYREVTPDLLTILANGSITADTIVLKSAQLKRMLLALTSLSYVGEDFLVRNGDALVDLFASSLAATDLLKKYSPVFTCFLQGMDQANVMLEQAFGTKVAGVDSLVTVLHGNKGYENPKNLPVMAANDGPNCHDMPKYDGTYFPESLMIPFDRGGEPNPPGSDADNLTFNDQPLIVQLFGPLAGLGGSS
ncbi:MULTISPECIES: MCE family protein [unclassified Nocardioides]|uniref:MCE family protein n=1 Tax=unclassified Nocardioides TaxID=2615069 RepID=UPI0006FEEB26|nr:MULTISPECIES: MCE family protein [unclassified Nocardioides]KRA31081.1 hypothetical protein ASD81_16480 [Nocardioides sp. Root614]KRA87701.1 hypothetical protein ASD84_16750 [Nocardioides sp. Root682]